MRNSIEVDAHRPMISWGAIFAGALIAFIVNIGLLSLGSGIGLEAFDPAAGETLGKGTLIMAAIYTIVAALAAFFAGAFVSAKMAGYRVRAVSALHGLSSWAVVSTMTILLVGMGVSKIAGAAFGLVSDSVRGAVGVSASAVGSAVQATAGRVDSGDIKNQFKKTMNQAGIDTKKVENKAKALPKQMAQAQAETGDGERPLKDAANQAASGVDENMVASVMAQKLGISEEQAKSLLDQGEGRVQEVMNQIGQQSKEIGLQAAQATTDVAGKAGWMTFLILLLGAGAAIGGGLVGGPKENAI